MPSSDPNALDEERVGEGGELEKALNEFESLVSKVVVGGGVAGSVARVSEAEEAMISFVFVVDVKPVLNDLSFREAHV